MGETAAAFDGIFWIGRIRDHVSSSQKFSDDRILWGTADLAVFHRCNRGSVGLV